jgi:hypothetical protein
LAVFLTTLAVVYDGDVVTEKVSIGGEATELTSFDPTITGPQLGLNNHNPYVSPACSTPFYPNLCIRFESDASLTRNDYYLANGDDYSFNGTLFKLMTDTVSTTSSPQYP